MEDFSSAELKAYVKDEDGAVSLDLSRKGLSRIPELTEVQELSLEENKLTKLPTSIQKLNWLRELHLDENNLSELPAVDW